MSDDRFVKARKQVKDARMSLCRTGQHYVPRNTIVVQHDKHQGVCGRCVGRRTQRHPGDTVDLASYWTRDWPVTMMHPVGQRRTWAAPPRS